MPNAPSSPSLPSIMFFRHTGIIMKALEELCLTSDPLPLLSLSGSCCPQAAGDQAPVLELRVMSAGTDPITQLQGADVVVMDPPRKGIEPELMEALMVSGLSHQLL